MTEAGTADRPVPLADELALIVDAGRRAGKLAMRDFGDAGLQVRFKDGDSPVTRADYAVDGFLRDTLIGARPDYGWLSEETEDEPAQRLAASRTFIVDPIDGTRAFIDGRDVWCVSIAIVERGQPIAGVLECPALGETITAMRGGGAHRNGHPITVRRPSPVLTIGGPRPMVERLAGTDIGPFQRHKHVPSLAYRISMIARGAMDASFVKPASADWDIAAAQLILQEAGGLMVDARGRNITLNGRDPIKDTMIACHPDLKQALLGVVGGEWLG